MDVALIWDIGVKSGPFFILLVAGALAFVFSKLASVDRSIRIQAAAQQAQAQATDKLADGLLAVSRNQERSGEGTDDMIRMMERFQAAEAERHASNVNSLNGILTAVNNNGRHRP
jgi:hypothetical protein